MGRKGRKRGEEEKIYVFLELDDRLKGRKEEEGGGTFNFITGAPGEGKGRKREKKGTG